MEIFTRFDGVVTEHLNPVHINTGQMPDYLGDKTQNELLFLIGLKPK